MHQTEIYQLSQWEPDDRILREDFNSDNAKLEAALLRNLGRVEVIQETVFTESQVAATLDMTGFAWGDWSFVAAAVWTTPSFTSDSQTMNANLTGCTLYGVAQRHLGLRAPGPILVLLCPLHDAARTVTAFSFPGGDLGYAKTHTYADIEKIQFGITSPLSIPAGTRLALYGVR